MPLSARIPKHASIEPFIARIAVTNATCREEEARLILKAAHDSENKAGRFLSFQRTGFEEIPIPPELDYLKPGDIIRVNAQAGEVRVLYRQDSPHNTLFFTERCNSRCLMCSQPPRPADDSYLIEDILAAIPLMSPSTRELCITGGEPTLLGDKLFDVIEAAKHCLPKTALHILSNGRLLSLDFVKRIARIDHPDLMIGIPLYSDIASKHDFVVQAKGAFDETVRGILNLGRCEQRVEIRFVLHKQTFERLPQTARFIARNLPFVQQVALMGLEMMGFTKTNLEALWIDPVNYHSQLLAGVRNLDQSHVDVRIYNHQLCVLPRELWRFARKSISDWKNIYLPECQACVIKEQCGGFFASALVRYSGRIAAIREVL
jgi:His-Xaa-Ser system radical SAM maturase HxsC